MMRFVTILFILLFSLNGFSQTTYPTNQWFGSASTLTEFKGAAKAAHAFINGVYADTSAANLIGYFRFYPGAQIMAGDSMYFRDKTAMRWLLMNGSGGGGGGFFSPDQTSTGNTSHDAGGFNLAVNNIGDLGLNSENTNLIANSDFTIIGDSVRMNSTSGRITFPNLTASDDTTTYKPMGRDAATGRLRQLSHWPGGGGGGGTWGSITGTLSNQTDLQNALNNKVTSFSVATANGFAGSVTSGATPIATLSTNQTGLLYGNGTSMTGQALGYDFLRSGDSLKIQDWVNVLDFGAVGDGVTNNTTAFQNAVNTGKAVYVPPGTYLLTTSVNLRTNQTLFAHDWSSIIKITANTRAIVMDSAARVTGIKFVGNGKAGSGSFNTGISLNGSVGAQIDNCMFTDFAGDPVLNGGGGIFGSTIASNNSDGARIINNYFLNNDCGLNMPSRAEYTTISNNTFGANTCAILGASGNLTVNNNIIQNNTTGFKTISATNGAHSTINNNLINHNTYAIWLEDCDFDLGLAFGGNMIYYGAIVIINSGNVKFDNCHFSRLDSVHLDNTSFISINGGWWGQDITTASPIPINLYNGAESLIFFGVTRSGEAIPNNWIKQIHNDTVSFYGPMYHTGITPASSLSSDSVWVKASTGQWKLRAQSDISGGISDGDKGDVTVSGSGSVWTIDNDVVTFAKMQNITQARLLGRYTASTGDMQEITIGSGLSLDAGTGILTSSGGSNTFVGLTDGPGVFTGQAGKSVRVNVGETALEYFTAAGTGDVIKVGTPTNHQWGVWTGDGTLKGVSVTASRAVATDANGDPVASATTSTELGYVNGVTSAIQTQIDGKQIKDIGIIQAATYTLTSSTSLQKLFDAVTNGEITVSANTTYRFECMFSLSSMSATSGNTGFDIIGAGTATATSAHWTVVGRDGTSLNTATNSTGIFSSATAETGNIVAAATSVNMYAYITGIIRINGGGTIIPSVNLTNAAAAVVGVNSYFKLTPIGSGSVTSW